MSWIDDRVNSSVQQNSGAYGKPPAPQVRMQDFFGGYGGEAQPLQQNGQVNGSDMASIFTAIANHLATQDAMAPQRQQFAQDFTFGRHLGTGGGEITPTNPTGNLSDPWAAGGLFNGNATNVAATAERARPTGTNYGPVGPGVQSSQTLAPLTDAGMRNDEIAYAPRIPDPNHKFGLPVPPPHQKPFRAPGTF